MEVDRLPRRAALKTLGVAAVAAAAACTVPAARSEDKKLTTSDFMWPYEKAIETDSDARAVMASPSLSNASIYFVQADNWLRSMERDYKYDPAKIRLVMANYGPMNFITYNDSIWSTYKAGEWQQVNDPQTKQPATRNPFVAEIKKLQDRQCVFLTWKNTIENHARAAVDTGRAPGKTFEQVIKELEDNLIPGAYAIGAQVAEIGRLQQKGFPYIFVPKQFWAVSGTAGAPTGRAVRHSPNGPAGLQWPSSFRNPPFRSSGPDSRRTPSSRQSKDPIFQLELAEAAAA